MIYFDCKMNMHIYIYTFFVGRRSYSCWCLFSVESPNKSRKETINSCGLFAKASKKTEISTLLEQLERHRKTQKCDRTSHSSTDIGGVNRPLPGGIFQETSD